MTPTFRLALMALGLMALILLPFAFFGDQIETSLVRQLTHSPPPALVAGLVFAALAADVVLPLPASLLSAAAAVWLGPVLAVLVIWSGMTLGHVIGYGLGRRFGSVAVRRLAGDAAQTRLGALGRGVGLVPAVILTRAVPVLSEACTVIAGAAQLPFRAFFLACAGANLGVALVYGLLGTLAGITTPFLLVFAVSIAVPLLGYGLVRVVTGRL